MNFTAYQQVFESILQDANPTAPYNNPDYLNYTKLNWSRQQRWLKTGVLSEEMITAVKNITEPQQWIVITEPWCGDASHIVPFLYKIAELNPLIQLDIQLRDTAPFLIEQYLTNGGKSIPKLIIRDNDNNDMAVWGPRPVGCQVLYDRLKAANADFEQMKIELQQWYNEDKGRSLQQELLSVINSTCSTSVA